MRKTLGVCLLVLSLSAPVVAGEMPNWTPAPPPPARAVQEPTNAAQDPTLNGEIPNDVTDTVTQVVMELLAVLPSLL